MESWMRREEKNEEVEVMQLNRLDKRERGTILGFPLSRRLGFFFFFLYIYIFYLILLILLSYLINYLFINYYYYIIYQYISIDI
jgi:hypothetical protein